MTNDVSVKLKVADWGITVDKSKATETFPIRETVFPKGSRLNQGYYSNGKFNYRKEK